MDSPAVAASKRRAAIWRAITDQQIADNEQERLRHHRAWREQNPSWLKRFLARISHKAL